MCGKEWVSETLYNVAARRRHNKELHSRKTNNHKLVNIMVYTNDIALTVRNKGKVKEAIRSRNREAKEAAVLLGENQICKSGEDRKQM